MRKMSVVLSVCILLVVVSGGVPAHAGVVTARYTDDPDDTIDGGAHNGADPEQVIETNVPDKLAGWPRNIVDYNFKEGQIDALAEKGAHSVFMDLLTNRIDLFISVAGDPDHPAIDKGQQCVFREYPSGRTGTLWYHKDFSNQAGQDDPNLADVDALDVLSAGSGEKNPSYFSLEGDPPHGEPPWSTCVFYRSNGTITSYVKRDFVFIELDHLGWNGNVEDIDVDALMVMDRGEKGVWDHGDWIYFSIRACGNWDGGEIVVMKHTPLRSHFLVHGHHIWNTSFDVGSTFGVDTEEVDALDAYSPSGEAPTLTQWGAIALLLLLAVVGIVILHRRRWVLAE